MNGQDGFQSRVRCGWSIVQPRDERVGLIADGCDCECGGGGRLVVEGE